METHNLKQLPFYDLSDNQLREYLRINKTDLLEINTTLSDYLRMIDQGNKLNDLNFSYVTETEFNNKIQCISDSIEFSVLHLNIRSLNRNHRALYQFLEMLSVKFDVLILSEIWSTSIDSFCNLFSGYSFYYDLLKDSNVGGIGM